MGLVMAMLAVTFVLLSPILIPLELIGVISPELSDMLYEIIFGIM